MLALLFWIGSAVALGSDVHVLELSGGIDPGSADYVVRGIHDAEAAGAEAVVLQLDTPGGLLASTREIVSAELRAEIPVVVFVAPNGARAASAGLFVTMAAHVAAMAPGTTIGAAHPVAMFGEPAQGEAEEDLLGVKILSDTLAWARAIAEQRGRNGEWAERAVRDSEAATAQEALDLQVIDLLAEDVPSLLRAIHGTTVRTATGPVVLHTATAGIVPVDMRFRQRVVHVLGDPNVLFVLIALGFLGLYLETQTPGTFVPGALGALALVAAAIGLSIVPFNGAGLVLVILGLALFGLEAVTPSHGILTVAGSVALLGGGTLLFDVEGFDLAVARGLLLAVVATMGAIVLAVGVLVARDRAVPPAMESAGLAGAVGEVVEGGAGGGTVRVSGEIWRASWDGALAPGRPVRVTAVHGLAVDVVPVEPAEART